MYSKLYVRSTLENEKYLESNWIFFISYRTGNTAGEGRGDGGKKFQVKKYRETGRLGSAMGWGGGGVWMR